MVYSVTTGIKSPATRKKYQSNMKLFLQHFDFKSETELLQFRENTKYLEGLIIRYITSLSEDKHLKYDTIHNKIAPVLHFLEFNDVGLNKRKIRACNVGDRSVREDEAYTHEQIRKILSKCDIRSKVIVLLMASTGMRIGAIPDLKLKHLKEIPEHGIYKITIYSDSAPDSYYTFCSFECAEAIRAYKKYRQKYGENIDDKDAPLIREVFNIRDRFKAKYSKPKHVSVAGLETLLYRIIRNADVDSSDVKRAHGFRKFYCTQWVDVDGNFDIREFLLGHRFSRVLGKNYDRTREDRRLLEYLKVVDRLTFNEELRLKLKIYELETQHTHEWDSLKAEMNQMKQILDTLGLNLGTPKPKK